MIANISFVPFDISIEKLNAFWISFMESLLIIFVFYGITFVIMIFTNLFSNRLSKDKKVVVKLIRKIINSVILLSGLIAAMHNLGIDVRAFILRLGLLGFAVGYAFKDVIANALAGMMIILYRPFVIGDIVSIGGVEGEITNIDMRHTTLRKKTHKFLVPNSKILSENISIKH